MFFGLIRGMWAWPGTFTDHIFIHKGLDRTMSLHYTILRVVYLVSVRYGLLYIELIS